MVQYNQQNMEKMCECDLFVAREQLSVDICWLRLLGKFPSWIKWLLTSLFMTKTSQTRPVSCTSDCLEGSTPTCPPSEHHHQPVALLYIWPSKINLSVIIRWNFKTSKLSPYLSPSCDCAGANAPHSLLVNHWLVDTHYRLQCKIKIIFSWTT